MRIPIFLQDWNVRTLRDVSLVLIIAASLFIAGTGNAVPLAGIEIIWTPNGPGWYFSIAPGGTMLMEPGLPSLEVMAIQGITESQVIAAVELAEEQFVAQGGRLALAGPGSGNMANGVASATGTGPASPSASTAPSPPGASVSILTSAILASLYILTNPSTALAPTVSTPLPVCTVLQGAQNYGALIANTFFLSGACTQEAMNETGEQRCRDSVQNFCNRVGCQQSDFDVGNAACRRGLQYLCTQSYNESIWQALTSNPAQSFASNACSLIGMPLRSGSYFCSAPGTTPQCRGRRGDNDPEIVDVQPDSPFGAVCVCIPQTN